MVRHPENPAGVSLPDHLRKRGERAQATRGDVPGDGAPSSDDRQAARDFLVFWDQLNAVEAAYELEKKAREFSAAPAPSPSPAPAPEPKQPARRATWNTQSPLAPKRILGPARPSVRFALPTREEAADDDDDPHVSLFNHPTAPEDRQYVGPKVEAPPRTPPSPGARSARRRRRDDPDAFRLAEEEAPPPSETNSSGVEEAKDGVVHGAARKNVRRKSLAYETMDASLIPAPAARKASKLIPASRLKRECLETLLDACDAADRNGQKVPVSAFADAKRAFWQSMQRFVPYLERCDFAGDFLWHRSRAVLLPVGPGCVLF